MSGIVDPAVGCNESGDHLLIGINWDRSFQELFSDFTGSFREIMAAVSARKTGWIDSGYGDIFVRRVEQVHGLFEGQPKIESFYPAEKFLECGEMGYDWEIKDLLNSIHISNVFDEFPVVLVPEIFEQNQDEQLVLGVDLLRKLTWIRLEMGWIYNRYCRLDKPDIPACWSLNCLLAFCAHIMIRRHCTLDLSVVGTIYFRLAFPMKIEKWESITHP